MTQRKTYSIVMVLSDNKKKKVDIKHFSFTFDIDDHSNGFIKTNEANLQELSRQWV